MSWVSMSPRTQPPPWMSRMAAWPTLPASTGTYLRSRIGPAELGTVRSATSPMSGGAISVLARVRRYSSRAASGERLHSGMAVEEDAQYNSASVSRSRVKLGDALPTSLAHHLALGVAGENVGPSRRATVS